MGLFRKSYRCLRCGHISTKFSLRDRYLDPCPNCGSGPLMNVGNIYDLRSEEEIRAEAEAYADVSLGPEADTLVSELIEIGEREEGYLSDQPGGSYDENGKHVRAREIGERLNQLGGKDLMVAAAYRVKAALGSAAARYLESAWAFIGDWLP